MTAPIFWESYEIRWYHWLLLPWALWRRYKLWQHSRFYVGAFVIINDKEYRIVKYNPASKAVTVDKPIEPPQGTGARAVQMYRHK